jgi:hypothetical protein
MQHCNTLLYDTASGNCLMPNSALFYSHLRTDALNSRAAQPQSLWRAGSSHNGNFSNGNLSNANANSANTTGSSSSSAAVNNTAGTSSSTSSSQQQQRGLHFRGAAVGDAPNRGIQSDSPNRKLKSDLPIRGLQSDSPNRKTDLHQLDKMESANFKVGTRKNLQNFLCMYIFCSLVN